MCVWGGGGACVRACDCVCVCVCVRERERERERRERTKQFIYKNNKYSDVYFFGVQPSKAKYQLNVFKYIVSD